MTSQVDPNLKIPYEIGCFIAALVPALDDNHDGEPWAEHDGYFKGGPNPFFDQTSQGLILEVLNFNSQPHSIYTKYGSWTVLGSSRGSFDKVFEAIKEKLGLKKIEKLSTEHQSLWAIKSWNGSTLDDPVLTASDKYTPYETAKKAWKSFQATLPTKNSEEKK